MALPVTITGISTAVAPVGPFKTTNAPAIAQSSYSNDASFGFTSSGVQWAGQSFTTVGAITVASIKCFISKTLGATANVWVTIRSTDPNGTVIATSNSVVAADINTAKGWITFTFPSPPSLSAATAYGFRLHAASLTAYGYSAGYSSTNPYAGGSRYSDAGEQTGDLMFTVYDVAGNTAYYLIGRDGTNAPYVSAQKATDPTSSWSEVAEIGYGIYSIYSLAAFQADSIVHIIFGLQSGLNIYLAYNTFDLSTESFGSNETILSDVATAGQTGSTQYGCSLVVRSNGDVVAFFNGAQTKKSGTNYARVYYAVRTTGWGTPVEVDDGGTADSTAPLTALGASDRVHFIYKTHISDSRHRSLSSGNVLDTEANLGIGITGMMAHVTRYDRGGGTIRVVVGRPGVGWLFLDSGANPTITQTTTPPTSSGFSAPAGIYVDDTDVWAVQCQQSSGDLFAYQSTDDAVNYSDLGAIFTGTVSASDAALSRDGNIYQRGSAIVIPYVVNDNGTLKYNEYTVRTLAYELTATNLATGSPALATPTLQIEGVDSLAASALTVTAPSLGTPALAQQHVLTATDLVVSAPSFGTAALVQDHTLAASALAVGAPTFEAPTLLLTTALAAIALTTGPPALGDATLVSTHVLVASDFATSSPVLEPAALTQQHVLVSNDFATGSPVLATPSIGEGELALDVDDHIFVTFTLDTTPTFTTEAESALTATALAVGQPALAAPALEQVHVLASIDLVVASVAIDAPALGQEIALAAAALVVGSPAVELAALLQQHALNATALAAASPTLATPPLAQEAALAAAALATAAPALGAPTLVQDHALAAADLATGAPTLALATLGQASTLAAASLVVAAPAFAAPALTQQHGVAAADLVAGAPTLDAPALTQEHGLAASDIVTGVPALDTPTVGQEGVIAAVPLVTAAPLVGTPVLLQEHTLEAVDLATSAPAFGTPSLAGETALGVDAQAFVTYTLDTTPLFTTEAEAALDPVALVVGQPAFAAPAFGQSHALTAADLVAASAIIGTPVLGQEGVMAVVPLVVGGPALDSPLLTQQHAFIATDLAVSAPILGAPALAQQHVFVASDLATGVPALATPTLGQEGVMAAAPLAVGAPALDSPALTQAHGLATIDIAVASPVLATPALEVQVAMVAAALIVSSPVLGTPALGQHHGITAASLATGHVVFPTPYLNVPGLLWLGDRVLDHGLAALAAEADAILLCSATPTNYSNAILLSLGEANVGTGNLFAAPAPGAPGGRISISVPINGGSVTANGTPTRWAAIDSVNERLLAVGPAEGFVPVTVGASWALDSIPVHLDG